MKPSRLNSEQRILARGPRIVANVIGFASSLFVLLCWYMATEFGFVEGRFLPSPLKVWAAFFDLKPGIHVHLLSTFLLVGSGWILGTTFALGMGLLLRQSFIIRSIFTPILESFRPVPVVATVPFFIIWFGFSWYGKLILVSVTVFLIVVIGVLEAIDNLPPVTLRSILSFGGSNWDFLWVAALPSILPQMLAPMRIAFALAVSTAVVAEFMGSTVGVGHVLNVSLSTFATHTILLCTITLGVCTGLVDWLIRIVHRKTTSWSLNLDEAI
jgi:ABC-type nitrate/sulfonate/bicarbonate transport system permease component